MHLPIRQNIFFPLFHDEKLYISHIHFFPFGFSDSAVRKQYSAGKISVNDFSAIRRDGRFTSRSNVMSSLEST